MDETDDVTEPLINGQEIPSHPTSTNSRRITVHGKCVDADDGTVLRGGLHRNEIAMLTSGDQMALKHRYAYVILNNHVYHTRRAVVIHVKCVDAE